MHHSERTVAKNFSVLMVSQMITWGLAILLTIFLPRYLGAAEIGRFQLAGSIWAIVSIFVAFGMDTFLTKEVARVPERLSEWYSLAIVLRSGFMVIGFLVVAVYMSLLDFSAHQATLVWIIGVSYIIGQFSGITMDCLQGLERMEFLSLADIVSKAFLSLTTIVLLILGFRSIMAAVVVVVASVIALVIQFLALRRVYPLRLRVHWGLTRQLLTSSLPYLVNVGIRTAYVQIDILIISWVASEMVIGWYSAASRLFSTLLFIPTVLMTAIFPLMSRTHTQSPNAMPAIIRRNFDLMLLFGVPIGLGLFLVADPAVLLLFGEEFAPSGPVLAIMGIVLIMTYLNILIGQYLISTDQQNVLTWIMAIACLVTVPLDIYLIPLSQDLFGNGAIGGALSFLATEAGMTLYGMTRLPAGTLGRSSAWMAARIFLAGFVMAAAAWWFRQSFIVIPIVVSVAVYPAMVWLLRIISKEDWELLKSLFQGALAKFKKPSSAPTQAGG